MKQAEPDESMRILLLEDSDFDAELIEEFLGQLQPAPEIIRAVGRSDYMAALGRERVDVILSDYSLPGFDGMAALSMAAERAPGTPFIFVSGVLGEEIAIESLRNGATDYVLKQRLIRLPAAVARAVAEAREREERRRAEEQHKLLVAELSHRVKNTLATVMSIVRRTARSAESVQDYESALVSRLRALSEAHSLLFEVNWRETPLDQVLSRTVEPYRRDGERVWKIAGPKVKLNPKSALALSLIFHELVTNAVKYGALSRESGRVKAEWLIEGGGEAGLDEVHLTWTESGGPQVTPPKRIGFGTHLIERSAQYELDGKAVLRYLETGFVCELRFAAIPS
jgi:two-component sensor histidine kinase/CheY-like chemotaxis protein